MLPTRLLYDVTLLRAVTTTDAYGATVPDTWTQTTITARIEQSSASEVTGQGRHGEVSTWRMWTNYEDVRAADRVLYAGDTYEVVGLPAPMRTASTVHHYAATLRLVEG